MKKKMRRFSYTGLSALLLLLLTGCWDSYEPDRMVYAHAIGIDYKDGYYTIYLQLLNLGILAKQESGSGSDETKVEVGKASGKTIDQAIFNLYESSQRRVFWGHLAAIIFTEEALRAQAVSHAVDLFDRYRETRYRMWMYATREPLDKLLTTVPVMQLSTALSRLVDPYASYDQRSILKPVDMRELLIFLNEPPHEAIIPLVGTNENNWRTDSGKRKSIQLEGTAIVTANSLKKVLPLEKSAGLKWVNKDLNREDLRIRKGKYKHTSILINHLDVHIKPIVRKEGIRFTIKVKAKGDLRELDQLANLAELEREAAKVMALEIRNTFKTGLEADADVLRLSEVLYRKNVQAWKRVQQQGSIPLTEQSLESIHVGVKIVEGEKQRKYPTLK
ncbi:Ger(x)C family spore germination protein [Pseudobacillus sp. FSL P4-0506]|uniref:Ger(x)C family spore germination protein n=1 Tax=unclassified Pseudobacillus TaxID=2619284 RepID=UPI0030F54E80